MAELIWLDGYSGETVEQLLALEGTHRIDSLVLAFEQALNQKAFRDGDRSLTDEERVIPAVEALEREVNNGGYDQFFVNSPEYASGVVTALRKIGCPRTAEITQSAISALGLTTLDVDAIGEVIYAENADRDNTLNECDLRYYDNDEDIAGRLFAFIKANKDKINL